MGWHLFVILFLLNTVIYSCKQNLTNQQSIQLEKDFEKNQQEAQKNNNGEKSLIFSIKAYEIAKRLGNQKEQGISCREIANDYQQMGQIDSAVKYIFIALKNFSEVNEQNQVASMFNYLGTLYFNQGDALLAVEYLNKALILHQQIGETLYFGEDLANLGEFYRMMGSPNKALIYQRRAMKCIDRNNNKSQYAYILGNLGLAYANINRIDSSDFYIGESTKLLQELGDNYPIIVYLNERANIAFQNGDYGKALEQVNKSLELAQNENFKQEEVSCYQLISEIQQNAGDFEAAFFAYQKACGLKDSITNIDLVREMERQRVDFEVSQREATILAMEKVDKWRTSVMLTLAVGILFISGLFFYNRKLNRKLQTINNQLEEKSAELAIYNASIKKSLEEKEVLLSEIHHRVKNNLQIVSSLLNMQARQLNDEQAIIAFENSQRRLLTIASVHQLLYRSKNVASIKFADYVKQLMDDIRISYASSKLIEYKFNIEDAVINLEKAMPLGLIINELATNSYKYAFNSIAKGLICISLKQYFPSNKYELKYTDNGCGLSNDICIEDSSSLGIRLIKILSKQLQGEGCFSSENGFVFKLIF